MRHSGKDFFIEQDISLERLDAVWEYKLGKSSEIVMSLSLQA